MRFLCFLPDKPSAPTNFKVSSFDETEICIEWEEPLDDGDCEITKYHVEKKEANKRTWSKLDWTEDMVFKAKNLTKGDLYLFRVAAENEVGIGEFAELSKPVEAKSVHGN